MSAPQGKKISTAGLEPPAAQGLEKGKKLLWKYEETRYFVSFIWSRILKEIFIYENVEAFIVCVYTGTGCGGGAIWRYLCWSQELGRWTYIRIVIIYHVNPKWFKEKHLRLNDRKINCFVFDRLISEITEADQTIFLIKVYF